MQKFFPQLTNRIYFENSGGTQIPTQVSENVIDFITNNYVQPGGFTTKSRKTEEIVKKSKNFVNTMINNQNGKIMFSTSATQIALNVASSLSFEINDEIILTNFSHESAIGCFERIENIKIKWWKIKSDFTIDYEELFSLVNKKTKLIVLTHVSNIVGNILNIKMITKKIKEINKECKIYVDGVAYLAHGLIDVEEWNIDFYSISFYKFLGLRISAIYIKNDTIINMKNLNHYFIYDQDKKIEIGGIQYEQCSSLLGIQKYLCDLTNDTEFSRNTVIKSFDFFKQKENNMIEYFDTRFNILSDKIDINIVTDYKNKRVPIFSIYSHEIPLDKLCFFFNKNNIECKTGNFYCQRLLDHLKIKNVLRISLVHYNSIEEIEQFFYLLEKFKTNLNNDYNYEIIKNNFSEKVKNSFFNLPIDKYYSNIRYRRFSLLKVYGFHSVGESSFIQNEKYNSFLGGELRIYENIEKSVLNDKTFQGIIKKFISIINSKEKLYDYLYVHQIRVEINDQIINPVPEGIHQDGYEYICITCVNKQNIDGPQNQVLDLNKNIVYTKIMIPGESLILNDRKFFHNVTPLKKILEDKSFRDIFVITTIS